MKYFVIVFNLLQKLNMFINVLHWFPPTAWRWCSQWGWYGSWSIPYMLLLKVLEHACDCSCFSNHSLVLVLVFFFLFSLLVRVGFPLFPVCWYLIRSENSLTLFWSHLSILFRLVEIMSVEKFSVFREILSSIWNNVDTKQYQNEIVTQHI
jgi:hypothetical protein